MQQTAIIVAGGSGTRMKADTPKQFLTIKGLPILMHTLIKFKDFYPDIELRVVLPESQINYWEELCSLHKFTLNHQIFKGGITRFQSVKNGLKDIGYKKLIAIHDGVRPLVSKDTISRCFKAAEEYGAAIPVIDVHETIRKIHGDYSLTVDRNSYKLVQTPQVFDAEILLEAYEQDYDESFTDDASVVESNEKLVMLVEGNRENIKITTPDDLKIAEALMQ